MSDKESEKILDILMGSKDKKPETQEEWMRRTYPALVKKKDYDKE